ncbi:hypothetical protein H072_9669 [Dactylellina haptotyla CBS 200.50]|uniref:F-box domain-containing protein n=1 Tax=Dactylellina haptotyla (strain CBS 200.50) TaxID=1284197 RepID=S8A193_DACHA|nr:hypothetical protein H072_9669 [Dactylellina haptotyla CBS 200.50]
MNGPQGSNGSSRPSAAYQALPFEIICEIVSYITSQPALYSTALVSRRYNNAATPLLYKHPQLNSSNFDAFVSAIAPSVSPPPRKLADSAECHLADLVLTLDFSQLVYQDTLRTSIARLLSHCRSIISLIGSHKSFNGVALRAVRHSINLEYLDLRPCQETCDLADFFHILSSLSKLTVLHFPRSALFSNRQSRWSTSMSAIISSLDPDAAETLSINITTGNNPTALKTTFTYPPNLKTFSIAGGIIDSTLINSGTPPASITSFSASHLPFVRMTAVRQYLTNLAPQLTRLSVLHPVPRLPHNFLDRILITCPNLLHLTASVDFLTAHIFDEENCSIDHPLERIDLDCSGGMGSEFKVSSDDISIALMEGRLKRLRVVRASVKLGWGRRGEEMRRVKDLAELLCMDRSGFGEGEEDEDEEAGTKTPESDPVEDIVGREPVGEPMGGETGGDDDTDEISGKLAGVWLF